MTLVEVGDRAPDVEVLDDLGRPVRLSTLWSRGPAVVAFLRHYG
jgi:peroxiredoxin